MVEIEEHARLRIDGSFRRVQIFRPGLLIGRERASRKGDNAAGLVGNREHDPIAKLRVEGCELRAASVFRLQALGCRLWAVGAGFTILLVIPSGARNLLFLTTVLSLP